MTGIGSSPPPAPNAISDELPPSFFQTVIETANEGIWLIDCQGRTTFANARMEAMLGLRPGAMLGKTPADFLLADDLELGARVIRLTLGGEPQEFDPRFHRADGSVLPTLAGSAAIRDEAGEVVGAVATFSDLTAHKEAQAQLAQQLAEVNALYRSAPIGLAFFDRQYRYLRINDELAQINGAPATAHLGRSVRELVPANADVVEPVIDRVFASGDAVRDLEVTGETPQQPGVTRHWLSGFYPVENETGEVEAVGAWVIEISERKAAEQREVLLAREVDHRAKNLLAVVQSVVQLTRAETAAELKEAILGRIQSLAHAHALLADARWDGVELSQLIADELAPFTDSEVLRARYSGPAVRLRPAAAQSIALILHELATNAAKYGALSSHDGELDVVWSLEGDPRMLVIDWNETGGVQIAEPTRFGFGSRIIMASVERQLRGRVTHEWRPDGLRCRLGIPLENATAPES